MGHPPPSATQRAVPVAATSPGARKPGTTTPTQTRAAEPADAPISEAKAARVQVGGLSLVEPEVFGTEPLGPVEDLGVVGQFAIALEPGNETAPAAASL